MSDKLKSNDVTNHEKEEDEPAIDVSIKLETNLVEGDASEFVV